ncbi:YdcF family protein [Patescibacteria group bacterium]|nr:YdcF family protein [Patescibacteria group bacterium]
MRFTESSNGRVSRGESRKLYESLWGGGVPDAFSLLANGVKKVGTVGRWKTGGYSDVGARGDINGSHGGEIAIRRLKTEYFTEAKVIANSFNTATKDWPEERHAEVAAAEFRSAGISEEDIIVQQDSVSTVTELLENIRLVEERNWKHLVIFTNGAQVERARAALEKIDTVFDPLKFRERPEIQKVLASFLEKRKKGEVKISIVAAEDALERMDERYARLMQEVRETELYRMSKARQDNAAEQIRAGTYGQPQNRPPTTILGDENV